MLKIFQFRLILVYHHEAHVYQPLLSMYILTFNNTIKFPIFKHLTNSDELKNQN